MWLDLSFLLLDATKKELKDTLLSKKERLEE